MNKSQNEGLRAPLLAKKADESLHFRLQLGAILASTGQTLAKNIPANARYHVKVFFAKIKHVLPWFYVQVMLTLLCGTPHRLAGSKVLQIQLLQYS